MIFIVRPPLLLLTLLCQASPDLLQAQQGGLRPKIGGLPADSGFALGVEYRKPRLGNGLFDFRGEVSASVKKYEKAELHLDLPRLWKERLFVELTARYRNYPEENFWGLGLDSSEGRRTNFRLEDGHVAATVGFRPIRHVRIGTTTGFLQANTGPGQDRNYLSIEELFTPGEVPALTRQPDYFHLGAFVQFDSRDRPLDPRSGSNYRLEWTYYDDRDLNRFTFRRYEVELQHFFPTHETRGTVAARGFLSLTDTSPGQQVPFFMQQTIGGSSNLRGFHQYRFRDKNLLFFNLEYRWGLSRFVEVIGFGDAGRVFARRSQFGLNDLEGSVGVGGRIKFKDDVFLGLDVGVSREGVRLWLRGSHTF